MAEGVAGTRMPRWGRTLSDEDMMYLVAFLKTLPGDGSETSGQTEVVTFSQLDDVEALNDNYWEIDGLNEEGRYAYGGGRQ